MGDVLVQIVFGWPAILASILLSVAGVWLKRPSLLITAGIVCIPFTYYLSGFRTPAVILPLFQFGSAFAIARQKTLLAWLFIAPIVMIAVLLAYVVLTQSVDHETIKSGPKTGVGAYAPTPVFGYPLDFFDVLAIA